MYLDDNVYKMFQSEPDESFSALSAVFNLSIISSRSPSTMSDRLYIVSPMR